MRSGALVLTALHLAPTALAATPHERNVAFLWSLLGEVDPGSVATMHDGRTMTLSSAVADAAARAGSVDLGAMASGAADPGFTILGIGDLWVIEIGLGDRVITAIPTPIPNTALHPQFWTYAGGIGTLETTDGSYGTTVIEWTAKTTTNYGSTNGFTAFGQQDFYCFTFFGIHLAFPFVLGWVEVHE